MSDLAALRDLVELDLDDTSNAIWSTADVDRGIKRALREYSQANPQKVVGTISLAADGREVSLSTLTGLIRVVRVWYPYTAADPEYEPAWVRFHEYAGTLYVISDSEPQSGEVVRVYYHKEHTIKDLESATSTTVLLEDEEVIVTGAGAYCAMQEARSAVGQAGVSGETPEHWLKWAITQMDAFHRGLRLIRAREVMKLDKRVPLWREGWQRDDIETHEDV